MSILTLSDPTNGTPNDANLIAANNTALKNLLNGGLENDNVKTTAAVGVSKLAAGSAGQLLRTEGTTPTWVTGVLYHAILPSTTTVDVVNDAAETTAVTESVSANILSTNRMVRLTVFGDYLNNSGSARNLTVRVKFGATTLIDDVISSIFATANRRPWRLVLELANAGATNLQYLGGQFTLGPGSSSTAGTLDFGGLAEHPNVAAANNYGVWPFFGTAAEDTTGAKSLVVTAQHSAADVNLSFRKRYSLAEVIGTA